MTRRKNYRPLLWIAAVLIVSSVLYVRFWPSESVPSLGSDMPKNIAMEPVTPQKVETPAAEVLSERIVEYHINVRLDESAHLLQGAQTVTWINPGKKR